MTTENPTAMGRWSEAWGQFAPEPTLLKLTHAYTMGPFDHTDYRGLVESHAPEQGPTPTSAFDPSITATGKDGKLLRWQTRGSLEGTNSAMLDLGSILPSQPWSVLYVYAEVEVAEPQMAELRLAGPDAVVAWLNDEKVYAPTIPWPANLDDDRALVGLRPAPTGCCSRSCTQARRGGCRCRWPASATPSRSWQDRARGGGRAGSDDADGGALCPR